MGYIRSKFQRHEVPDAEWHVRWHIRRMAYRSTAEGVYGDAPKIFSRMMHMTPSFHHTQAYLVPIINVAPPANCSILINFSKRPDHAMSDIMSCRMPACAQSNPSAQNSFVYKPPYPSIAAARNSKVQGRGRRNEKGTKRKFHTRASLI